MTSRLQLMLAIQQARAAGLVYFATALEEMLRIELGVPASIRETTTAASGETR